MKKLKARPLVIPDRYRHATFSTYDPKRGDPVALEVCMDWADTMPSHIGRDTDGRGILLQGSPGLGKTHLAVAMVREAEAKGYSTCFIPMYSLVMWAMNRFRLEDGSEAQKEWFRFQHYLYECDVLVLDDAGRDRKSPSGYVDDEIDGMLRHRGNWLMATHITSNLPVEEWSVRYNPAMASHLHEVCQIIDVQGTDDRTR